MDSTSQLEPIGSHDASIQYHLKIRRAHNRKGERKEREERERGKRERKEREERERGKKLGEKDEGGGKAKEERIRYG